MQAAVRTSVSHAKAFECRNNPLKLRTSSERRFISNARYAAK